MGDLRNKLAKQARDEAHRQFMARRYPKQPPPPPIRCQCGLTIYETPNIWAWASDRWSAPKFYCPACLPYDLFQELVGSHLRTGIRAEDEG